MVFLVELDIKMISHTTKDGSMSLSVSSFFEYYIFHPIDAPKNNDRWAALITTIALGILTLGFLHFICAFASYNRKFVLVKDQNEVEKQTTDVFGKMIKKTDGEVAEKTAQEIENLLRSGVAGDIWIELIMEKAKKDDRDFQYLLGKLYKCGQAGLDKSDEKAFLSFRSAAKLGHAKAQYHIASMYHSGTFVDKSNQKAAKYYLLSAEGGDSRAQFSIATMYRTGAGELVMSAKEAAKWFKKSALQNNDKAMNNLGVMYYHGEGVKESYDRSVYWLKKAIVLGNKSALKNLENILEAEHPTKKLP